jgi:hypothetical protein
MKLTININDDSELRAHIKDSIKGQVLSVVRGELLEIIKEELNRKMKGTDARRFDRMVQDALKIVVKDILRTEHKVSTWDNSFITPYIQETLDPLLAKVSWVPLIDQMAKEKVARLVKQTE